MIKGRYLFAAAMTGLMILVQTVPSAPRNSGQEQKISEDRIFKLERLDVVVEDFKADGCILDIGGGGEGIIGVLKGRQVVAIDLIKRELADAPPGPLKIVMDARDLKFLDGSFNTATAFFTFTYIQASDHEQVFKELSRVLVPGGRLLIWDVNFPKKADRQREFALFPLTIHLPDKVVNTGYGVRWPADEQGLSQFASLAQKIGLKVLKQENRGGWFFLELQK